jgi:uncharacterized membrane protein
VVKAAETQDHVGVHELHAREDGFRQRHPVAWAVTLYGPFALTAALLALLWAWAGWSFTWRIATSTVLALWVFGRFIILGGAEGPLHDIDGALSSAQLFALITYLDTMVALVLAFHIGFLFRLPWIGPRIAALVIDGQFILKSHPWMKRMTFVGLVAFVCFPLAATGSVGGSIFGRLLGMSRIMTFMGILAGSLLGNGIMYYFSETLNRWIDKDHPAIHYGGFAVIVVIVVLLERRYQKMRSEFALGIPAPLDKANRESAA